MAGLQNWLKNKQKTSVQWREGASMTTQWMRGGGNQVQGREKHELIGRFQLVLHRGINALHKFSCTRNTVCMHDM